MLIKANCLFCGKYFERKMSPAGLKKSKDNGKYCSRKCGAQIKKITMLGGNNPAFGRFGKNHPNWKGGRKINKDGYILIYKPKHPFARQKYIFEHRLIIEKHLNRYLNNQEVIHHINGNRFDNRLINLQLFKNKREHLNFHLKNNLIIVLLFSFFLIIPTCQPSPAFCYTNEQIANAIYLAEGGAKTKYPYGIKSINTFGNKNVARKICLNTIRNNRIRFSKQKNVKDFVTFLGMRYCPPKAHKLNENWVKNVNYWLKQGSK